MSDTDDTDREHELPADIIFRDAKRAMALSRGAVDQLKALKAGAASLALPVRHGFVARGDVLQELCEQAGRVGLLDEVGATVVEATIADGLDNPEAAAEPAEPQEATRQRLVPIPWSEIHSLPRREELIAGLLDRGAMSLVSELSIGLTPGKHITRSNDLMVCRSTYFPSRSTSVIPMLT
jgi:hypothetical protein